jgi:hypothetical protein
MGIAGSASHMKGKWKMGRRFRALAISVVVAAAILSSALDPWRPALAETPDDEISTNEDIAISAGTAAGIVASCGIDVAPIGAAFREFLAGDKWASPSQESLLRQYRAAEAAALSTPTIDNSGSCAGAASVMRDAVHSLTRSAS